MKIMITGGTGFLGQALVKRFYNKHDLIIFSRDEYKQYKMRQKYPNCQYVIGDIGDQIYFDADTDLIINTAAMKHVSLCQENKLEALKTNVIGVLNCCNTGIPVIHISTDKAVNPINFYGVTKKIAEEFVYKYDNCMIVRFGNLFGSRGSVVPLFLDKRDKGHKTYDISDVNVERYFLTANDAVDLIVKAMRCVGGKDKVISRQFKKIKIVDLVKCINPGAEINIVGLRFGEKMCEELGGSLDNNDYYTKDEIKQMLGDFEKEYRI